MLPESVRNQLASRYSVAPEQQRHRPVDVAKAQPRQKRNEKVNRYRNRDAVFAKAHEFAGKQPDAGIIVIVVNDESMRLFSSMGALASDADRASDDAGKQQHAAQGKIAPYVAMMQAAKDVYDARPGDATSITVSTRQPDAFGTRTSLAARHKKPAETVGVNIALFEPAAPSAKQKRKRPAKAERHESDDGDDDEAEPRPAAKRTRATQQQQQASGHNLCERCRHTIGLGEQQQHSQQARPTAAESAAKMLQQTLSDGEDDDDDAQCRDDEEEEPWLADVKEQILEKEPSMAGSKLLAKLGRMRKHESDATKQPSRDAG
jgi:hypothetical protein